MALVIEALSLLWARSAATVSSAASAAEAACSAVSTAVRRSAASSLSSASRASRRPVSRVERSVPGGPLRAVVSRAFRVCSATSSISVSTLVLARSSASRRGSSSSRRAVRPGWVATGLGRNWARAAWISSQRGVSRRASSQRAASPHEVEAVEAQNPLENRCAVLLGRLQQLLEPSLGQQDASTEPFVVETDQLLDPRVHVPVTVDLRDLGIRKAEQLVTRSRSCGRSRA